MTDPAPPHAPAPRGPRPGLMLLAGIALGFVAVVGSALLMRGCIAGAAPGAGAETPAASGDGR